MSGVGLYSVFSTPLPPPPPRTKSQGGPSRRCGGKGRRGASCAQYIGILSGYARQGLNGRHSQILAADAGAHHDSVVAVLRDVSDEVRAAHAGDRTPSDLAGADLVGADLRRADLFAGNLRGAAGVGADLRGAELVNVSLEQADLRGANLTGAKMVNVDLDAALLEGATWTDGRRCRAAC